MRNILIQPTPDIELKVTGSFVSGEQETNIRDSFLIFNIELHHGDDSDISELLQWANSKKEGTILEIIEELVLEKI